MWGNGRLELRVSMLSLVFGFRPGFPAGQGRGDGPPATSSSDVGD
jgi:hypothetical protein